MQGQQTQRSDSEYPIAVMAISPTWKIWLNIAGFQNQFRQYYSLYRLSAAQRRQPSRGSSLWPLWSVHIWLNFQSMYSRFIISTGLEVIKTKVPKENVTNDQTNWSFGWPKWPKLSQNDQDHCITRKGPSQLAWSFFTCYIGLGRFGLILVLLVNQITNWSGHWSYFLWEPWSL